MQEENVEKRPNILQDLDEILRGKVARVNARISDACHVVVKEIKTAKIAINVANES